MPSICPYCSREFPGDRVNSRHLAKCNPALSPKVEPCLCGHESTSLTQMKRHRQQCGIWANRDTEAVKRERMKSTSLERYGVESAAHAPEVAARRSATNLERYGAGNPFAKESSVFEKVQASLDGKRPVLKGADNPFAKPEVQAKIRAHWQTHHGVDNPQQVAEVRAATRATNLERYGVSEVLSAPLVREKIAATNETRYGGPAPSHSPEVNEKARQTNLARYGVPWTSMDPDVRRRQLEAMEARYGSHYFASDEGKDELRATLKERYGVENPAQIDGFWEKAVATFVRKYGVTHPLQLVEFLQKKHDTNIKRYGTPFPGLRLKGVNHLEARLQALAPPDSMLFTGDGKFWRWLPLLSHHKNPDFIVPGSDPDHPKRGVKKVVEAFGDFWHSRMFTGKAPFDHESELIAAYADVGLSCLVVWESEVKRHPDEVRARLTTFLGSPG